MVWVLVFIKSAYIFLGVTTILIGKYLPLRIIIPNRMKYKVIDEKTYVRACRLIFYFIGLCYVLYGIVLLFIDGWPFFVGFFVTMISALTVVLFSLNWRKYIEPI
ncbi:membrane hypothetical protein [Candidatus Desulfosporosinus infrequens]|uniref:DUF3784 domain-containing protein n=1 Tax=Candidatus Desulfosporosinus infrequens TaxID=2043169 RepID=A0A2U3LW46_9FIRM|nr:membrane hypothetical protein [Candidatus Desulfosporosinus infrequens]